jgi:hypothetical protein
MSITSGDIKLLKSQVNLDTTDGGGAMTSTEVVDGLSNNLFPDVSELDRTIGRVAMRKVFPAVDTNTVDSYFGAHAMVSRKPTDPRVGVSLFSTKDWFDRRDNARDKIERYLARGPKWAGHLLETQLEGQRAIQLALRLQDDEPKVGQGLALVENEDLPNEYEQYVRVTKITSVERVFTLSSGGEVTRKVTTVEISDPLRYAFHGPTVAQYEAGTLGNATCRDTRVANAATYYGASDLTAPAAINDSSVMVDSIFTQLVPSAQSETPMVDLTAAGLSSLYVPGNTGPITTSISAPVGPTTRLYIGSSIVPGTLSLNAGGNILTDAGGVVYNSTTEVGTIDYSKGLLIFNSAMPSYSGSMPLVFTPAGLPNRVMDTASIHINQDGRGYNYTITLIPSPMPGSLVVSYMAQGKVYYLYDQGNGALKGTDAAFGTGNINYATGSVIVTTGALPDANSEVIFAWGKKLDTFTRSGMTVNPARLEFQLGHEQVAPSTVTITWTVNAVGKTATDNGNGVLTGDATGTINYATGKIKLTPSVLYQQGTEFQIAYQWGAPLEQTFAMPTRDVQGRVVIQLPNLGGNPLPKTVELKWNVLVQDSELLGEIFTEQTWNPPPAPVGRDPLVFATDDGSGNFRKVGGSGFNGNLVNIPDSSIDYATRTITLLPDTNTSIPKPIWFNQLMGTQTQAWTNGGVLVTNTMRRIISSWQMVPTVALMPIDESGYVVVKWRTASGGTAATETFTAGALRFDLTPGFAEDILLSSVRFSLGGYEYIDRLGSLFHSINPSNGAGVQAGSVQYTSGLIEVTSWAPGAANTITLQSLVTEMNAQAADQVVFRVPIVPVRSGSLQLLFSPLDGNVQTTITADGTGRLDGANTIGFIDYETGVVRVKFGQKLTVTPAIQAEPWYTPEGVFQEGGIDKIIKPKPVYADSIRYNAVGYTYIPLSADVLGLDPVRLPSDGRVPIFRQGDVAVVHHTDTTPFPVSPVPAAGTALNVGRVRVSYIKLYDAADVAIDVSMYDYDLDAGVVTLGPTYVQGTYVLPLRAEHRIEDMALVTDVQINGQLALNRPLTHAFPTPGSLVSSALIFGDMQARVFGKFSQESWTSVWSDSIIGNPTTSQFNDTLYPIHTTNKGSLEEKWALIFTSDQAFRVVGQHIGQIATGNTSTDLAPLNPATGAPYFTLNALGWGSGWSAGNVLRFNTASANYPVWIARTVLQGPATSLNDSFQLQVRGDIDR